MKEWKVTFTGSLVYNSEDHADMVASGEDAIEDAKEWLRSEGINPNEFEFVVTESTPLDLEAIE